MGNFQSDGSAILKVFIGAIIAIAFMAIIANSIFNQTNTLSQKNVTVTIPTAGETTDLGGRTLITSINVLNATDNLTISATNVSLQSGTSSTTGLQTVQILNNNASFNGVTARIAYSYEPDGYLNNSGARSITLLILIFGSIAIMVFVIVVFIKDGSLGKLMGRS